MEPLVGLRRVGLKESYSVLVARGNQKSCDCCGGRIEWSNLGGTLKITRDRVTPDDPVNRTSIFLYNLTGIRKCRSC